MNKDEIRNMTKNLTLKTEKVSVGELGELYIHEMNARAYTKVSNSSVVETTYDTEKFLIYATIASTFDVNGTKIWEPEDFEEVANLPANVYTKIIEVVMRVNNIVGASNKTKN
jgi:hypothetical protein